MTIRNMGAGAWAFFVSIPGRVGVLWRRYRGLKLWQQGAILVLVLLLVFGAIKLLVSGGAPTDLGNQERTVTLSTVAALTGTGGSVDTIGTVRSVTEASILAQSGGTVRAVHTSLGAAVPAGFAIAELENASESASVLQAEGAYDAAVAARTIAQRQSQNSSQSLGEATVSVRNTYQSAYTALDTTLHADVDTFFGSPTATGPNLLINSNDHETLQRRRVAITNQMQDWQSNLANASTRDPEVLLDEAESDTRTVSDFLVDLAAAANNRDSRATATQLSALAEARASVSAQLTAISAARSAYRTAQTTADVGADQTQSQDGATASADANVKQALGALRGAQANLEKTIVRAPISGTVNFLPIRVGDYVTPMSHVATVAQNGALEIVAYVSEDTRQELAVGTSVTIDTTNKGTVTSIAPALDPTTKQIEVHIATVGTTDLVNGQSVHISVPTATPASAALGPLMLPLSAVKLMSDRRIVFTVGADGRLVAVPVEVGDVVGDRITITSNLAPDTRIVTDARGLAEGQKVQVAQ